MKQQVNNNNKVKLEALKKGNKVVFKEIYITYFSPLCYFAFKYTHDKADSEDVVQEILMKLWQNRKTIKINISLKSYLYKSVYNAYLDRSSISKRRGEILENIRLIRTQKINDLDENDFSEKIKKLRKAIEELPPRCKEIFILSKISGMKYKDIAICLNLSIKTVENQIGIAFKKLKEELN